MKYKDRIYRMVILFGIVSSLLGCGKEPEISLQLGNAVEASKEDVTSFLMQPEQGILTSQEMQSMQASSGMQPGQTSTAAQPGQTSPSMQARQDERIFFEEHELPVQQCYFVHIVGAVEKPGVYELPQGSRLYQLVDAADGFCEEAAREAMNLAIVLQDGQQYYIPTKEEVASGEYSPVYLLEGTFAGAGAGAGTDVGTQQSSFTPDGKLDINLATEQEFQQLTGIGATRASAIVSFREEHGAFSRIEDLMLVPGIKEGTFRQFQDEIVVR